MVDNDTKYRNPLISSEIGDSKRLLHSRYSLSKDEGRILLMCSEKMQRNDHDSNGEYHFTVSDYCEVFDITRSEALKDIKAAIDKLSERWIYIRNDESGDEISLRWIGKKMRNVAKGTFGVRFWPELLPFLHDLSEQHQAPLAWLAAMNNDNNQRILRWINEVIANEGHELIKTVDEIRYGLDIREVKSYKIYNNFKRRIILPAIDNINECTSLNVKYEEIKEGRKVVSLRFTWGKAILLQNAQ